jgi:hypothetical protein
VCAALRQLPHRDLTNKLLSVLTRRTNQPVNLFLAATVANGRKSNMRRGVIPAYSPINPTAAAAYLGAQQVTAGQNNRTAVAAAPAALLRQHAAVSLPRISCPIAGKRTEGNSAGCCQEQNLQGLSSILCLVLPTLLMLQDQWRDLGLCHNSG